MCIVYKQSTVWYKEFITGNGGQQARQPLLTALGSLSKYYWYYQGSNHVR